MKTCISSDQLKASLGVSNLLDIPSSSGLTKIQMDRGASDSTINSYFLFYPSKTIIFLINKKRFTITHKSGIFL
jgi:hypothetical protein